MKKETYWFYGDKFDLNFDPEVIFVDKKGISKNWIKHKLWSECSEEEQNQANLRKLAPYEVLIDIEDKEIFYKIFNAFDKFDMWSFETIRGGHIHLFCFRLMEFFKENLIFDKFKREILRGFFLNQVFKDDSLKKFCDISKIDFSMVSEEKDVSVEGKPYFKDLSCVKNFYKHSEGKCLFCEIMGASWFYLPVLFETPPSSLTSQRNVVVLGSKVSEEGGVLGFIYKKEKREQIEKILKNPKAKHNERIFLVGFLRYCTKTDQEIEKIIYSENKWTDYNQEITKKMIETIKNKKM